MLSVVTASNDGLRRRRREVLEVDTKENAADLLASLWESDGIKPKSEIKPKGQTKPKGDKPRRSLQASSKSAKGDMSFYYF